MNLETLFLNLVANSKKGSDLPVATNINSEDYVLIYVSGVGFKVAKKSDITFPGEVPTKLSDLDTPSLLGQKGKILIVKETEDGYDHIPLADVDGVTETELTAILTNYVKTINGAVPDENGNVVVEGGGTVTAQAITDALNYTPADDAEVVKSVTAGTNVTIDNTDPQNPIISASGGGGTAVERTPKVVTNTTQYTLVTADFTDFTLEFNANAGETISVILNAGVAPTVGSVQMISTGNNFLELSLGTGVTVIKPENTTFKTTGKGDWLGLMKLDSSNTFSLNGGLESTNGSGGTYTTFTATTDGLVPTPNEVGTTKFLRQDGTWVVPDGGTGTTYAPFTNTVDGLVPAPNVSGTTTYSIAITTPTEGQEFTEGDTINLTSTITENVASATKKVLKSDGWEDESNVVEREIKSITSATYTMVLGDENKFLAFQNTGLITIPANVFKATDVFKGTGDTSTNLEIDYNLSDNTKAVTFPPVGSTRKVKQNGGFEVTMFSATGGFLVGDFIKDYDIFQSPDGTKYKLSIANGGTVSITAL